MGTTLKFREDGSFKIIQLTDLHIGTYGLEQPNEADQKTFRLIDQLIQGEMPDLIVITGDLIWSGEQGAEKSYRCIMDHLSKWEIPFAIVYGNHDSEANITREELFAIQQDYPFSIAEPGPEEIHGVGNYSLAIQSHKTQSKEAYLYLLDSGDYGLKNVSTYGWVHHDQIAWFADEAKKHRRLTERQIPALAFFHIPTPEYKEVLQVGKVSGNKLEPVCSPEVNSGLFTALLEAGNVMGTFVGHDHDNDYCGELHGISLCYGRITGYNVYGALERGARVIQLFEGENRFESWLRLDDGKVVSHYQHEHRVKE